jgi:DNA-binding NarL/FixJ family response regulator
MLVESRRRGEAGGSHRLTAKQEEVLRLVGQGLPNRMVARTLDISEKTVKAHLTQIYSALGVSDRVQATLWAQHNLPQQ